MKGFYVIAALLTYIDTRFLSKEKLRPIIITEQYLSNREGGFHAYL